MIALRAVPSFDAFGRLLAAANPLLFWMRLTQAVWSPWLGGLGTAATLAGRRRGSESAIFGSHGRAKSAGL